MRSLLTVRPSPVSLLAGAYGFLAVADEAVAWQAGATTKVVGAGLVLAIAVQAFKERRARPPLLTLALPVALLAAWCALSILWSVDPAASRVRSMHLAFEALLLAALCVAPDRGALVRGLALGLGAGAAVVALGFLLELGGAHGARLHPFDTHGNLQGRDAALGALALGLLGPDRRLLALAGLAGVGLGLSFSSGAWLAAVVACAVLATQPDRRPLVATLLIAMVLGAGLLSVAGHDTRLRSPTTALQGNAVEEIGSGRLVLWGHAARISAAHPLRGVGAGAFPVALEEVRHAHQLAGGEHSKPGRRAHNSYLDLLAETGPLAVLLFLVPLAAALRAGRRRPMALALTLFVATSALTDSLLHQKSLWIALALAALIAAGDE